MNVLNKKGKERLLKKTIMEEIEWLSEHFDLLTLIALHEEFGFGADRLRRAYHKVGSLHDEFKNKYMVADDTLFCKNRCDTKAMKKYLMQIGFDYDAECDKAAEQMKGE
jgi:hypothetical protein